MVTLILLRHGETINNALNRTQGSSYDTPLTENGVAQINNKIEIIKQLGIGIDKIVTTNSGRTISTALIIKQQLIPDQEITFDEGLRAVNWGELANHPYAMIQEELHKASSDEYYKFPGGDSFSDVRERCLNSINNLESKFTNQTIILVGHAMVLKVIAISLCKIPISLFKENNMPNEYIARMILDHGKLIKYELLTNNTNHSFI